MKSGGLAEILSSGIAPVFRGLHRDPQCADEAIPRALRQLESQHSARKIAKDAGHSIDTLKKAWKI